MKKLVEKEQAISEGISYFNNERFWECHEILEGVWKNCNGNEKFLVQGLILVAAGLVHYQKDEDAICISIFNRALEKLEEFYMVNIIILTLIKLKKLLLK